MSNEATIVDTKKGGLTSTYSKEKPSVNKMGTTNQTNSSNLATFMANYQPYQGPKIVVTKQK